ncbi:MAG: hypothetical protein KUG79_01785 [Pseudomonadales bacterium]|nr:hypothetical protein [Pseudomonadales bacterium]
MKAQQPVEAIVKRKPYQLFENKGPDWRILLGAFCTLVWLLVLSIYISGAVGWQNIASVRIEILGSFLEGSFAPLAFLWFVLGYFSQQKELSQNTEAIKMQYAEIQKSAEQATIQAEAVKASEMHARRESFLRIAESVKEQLGAISGFLFISSQGATATGFVSPEKLSELWHAMGQSDPQIFSRQMLELSFIKGDRYAYKMMYGTPVRKKHSDNFIFTFERLVAAAEDCDTNGMIRDFIQGSAHGFVYNRLINFRDDPPPGFTLGHYDFNPDSFD